MSFNNDIMCLYNQQHYIVKRLNNKEQSLLLDLFSNGFQLLIMLNTRLFVELFY